MEAAAVAAFVLKVKQRRARKTKYKTEEDGEKATPLPTAPRCVRVLVPVCRRSYYCLCVSGRERKAEKEVKIVQKGQVIIIIIK